MKARGVDRESYPLFLDRAEEFLAAAHGSFARGHFQAATSNAVHAAIAAMDAITVFHAGKRSASDRHEEVLVLVRSLRLPDHDLSKRLVQLGRLLGMKTRAEYADARIKTWRDRRRGPDRRTHRDVGTRPPAPNRTAASLNEERTFADGSNPRPDWLRLQQ